MKKMIILSIMCAVIMCSCATYETINVEAKYQTIAYDFNPYLEKGFYFSSTSLKGTQAGVITIYYEPAKKVFVKKMKSFTDDVMDTVEGDVILESNTINMKPHSKDLLEAMYTEAKRIGANGVANLQVRKIGQYFEIYGEAVKMK